MLINIYGQNVNKMTPYHRPFYPTSLTINVCDNPDQADFILGNNKNYKEIISNPSWASKSVFYANDDDPSWLYGDEVSHKFVAQPKHDNAKLSKHNITCIPLVMTDHMSIHDDHRFIDACRKTPKTVDFMFSGQVYGKRSRLFGLHLSNSVIEKTGSIYSLNPNDKLNQIKTFLTKLSHAKFGFCPRGVGSNSFRLYECLMVGVVPIITDVIQLPFTDDVDWESFATIGSMDNIEKLVEKALSIKDYDAMKTRGQEFWYKYCNMRNLHDMILRNLNASS